MIFFFVPKCTYLVTLWLSLVVTNLDRNISFKVSPDMYILGKIMTNVLKKFLSKMSHFCLVTLSEHLPKGFDLDDVWSDYISTFFG